MHITTIALIISILGLITSFGFVGIIPSLIAFVLNILNFKEEQSIRTTRPLAISFAGILLPLVMYLNSYGVGLPYEKPEKLGMLTQIIYDNYSRLGFDMSGLCTEEKDQEMVASAKTSSDMYYISDGVVLDDDGAQIDESVNKISKELDPESIFESIDSLDESSGSDYGADKKGASDDDMPSYGGLPIGTLILGQYFREDDHNCNPVLVLQNETGNDCRFECLFTARDEEGNELATSNKTVEVVKDGEKFVFEGRFDKDELGRKLPAMYEFLISKREPYEDNLYDEVTVLGEVVENSAFVTAMNTSKKKAKVDAYVLFFDGDELVDCIWMIPQNSGEVCIEPGSSAAIKGDAYYKFDRIETYYTAYEAVGE
ncbi:hypothetical protein [Butyrivibrio proteoclasticus]|uniref:hypothetical protein n=1 Tax=Butyrivibrio proteoclasticus TaxID=43305 RepID=UPI00047B94A3|nr:hypothetical protein [Butyrivibrio proteoclasticus]